jgi:hypothetical protein
MDTQNVSAQLYNKQLPRDPSNNTATATDTSIENAFQKQLDLSEYYKSPQVFDVIKRDYMDRTMEGETEPPPQNPPSSVPTPKPVPVYIEKSVGPTDFLYNFIKSKFGATNSMTPVWVLVGLFALVAIIFIVERVYSNMKNKTVQTE